MTKNFICTADYPVVQTKYGKLRGFQLDDMYHFYGIKYADAKRFMMPTEPESWDGIKDALSYGYVCPIIDVERPEAGTNLQRFWPKNEDCQYLNIWTSTLEADAKKPVVVWIHGGVFSDGSSIKRLCYDGKNLAQFGDLVMVSVNHRLNILGYFDLTAFGERYWNTPNLGQADLVAALQWVHDNIAGFGGDPNNVTLLGQSGGGGKINALLQTPAADNLFHKAIIHSGLWREDTIAHLDAEGSKVLVEQMFSILGISSVEEMEAVPFEDMAKAYNTAAADMKKKGYGTGLIPLPTAWYKGSALDIGFTEAALKRPVIAGTIFAEFTPLPLKDKHNLSEEERYAFVEKKYGDNTDEVLETFKKVYPEKNIVDATVVDSFFREPALAWLDAKAKAGGAPNYSFMFAPDFTMDGGKPAWHGGELPFAFHNVELTPIANIPCADKLELEMAGAWAAFAHTGDPNHDALVRWEPYTEEKAATMLFAEETRMVGNEEKDLVLLIDSL